MPGASKDARQLMDAHPPDAPALRAGAQDARQLMDAHAQDAPALRAGVQDARDEGSSDAVMTD